MTHVRKLRSGDHRIAGGIIGSSFADDPVNNWIFGNESGMSSYYTLVARKLYLVRGYGHCIDDDACTLWLPPGISKEIPLLFSLDIAASMTIHSGCASIIRGTRLDSALKKKRPVEPHHYLFAIGARPARQGKGLGGSVMAAGLKCVDEDRMPAYLESSKESNVSFYQRFGFELLEKTIPADGSPPMWLMWREARR